MPCSFEISSFIQFSFAFFIAFFRALRDFLQASLKCSVFFSRRRFLSFSFLSATSLRRFFSSLLNQSFFEGVTSGNVLLASWRIGMRDGWSIDGFSLFCCQFAIDSLILT